MSWEIGLTGTHLAIAESGSQRIRKSWLDLEPATKSVRKRQSQPECEPTEPTEGPVDPPRMSTL